MATQPPRGVDHEDGSWFLEAVGAKPPAPQPSDTLSALEQENSLPEDDSTSEHAAQPARPVNAEHHSFDGDPGTSTSSFDPIPIPPPPPPHLYEPAAVEPPPDVGGADDDFFDDAVLAPSLRTKRRLRWPTIGFLVFLAAIAALALLWLPRVQEQQAVAVRQANFDSSLSVRTYLPTSQTALDSITDPESTDDAVASAVAIIASLSSRGSNLASVAAEPLPVTVPVLTPSSVENLDVLTQQSTFLAADTTEVARRLGHGYVYRTSVPMLMDTGALPSIATTAEIDALSVTLASSLAEDTAIVVDLPDDPAFAPTLALASSTLEQYNAWQTDYLGALTAGSEDAANTLIDQLDVLKAQLGSTTSQDLLTFRVEIDSRIVELAGSFDTHLANLSR